MGGIPPGGDNLDIIFYVFSATPKLLISNYQLLLTGKQNYLLNLVLADKLQGVNFVMFYKYRLNSVLSLKFYLFANRVF